MLVVGVGCNTLSRMGITLYMVVPLPPRTPPLVWVGYIYYIYSHIEFFSESGSRYISLHKRGIGRGVVLIVRASVVV